MHGMLPALKRGFKRWIGWRRVGIAASVMIIAFAVTTLLRTLKGIDTGVILTALTEARADGKLVLLDFGANWCLDCIVLSHLFEDKTVHPFLDDNFHVVSIDVGNWDRNLDVSKQYGSPIDNGIPAVVILTGSGDVLASTKSGALADARTATAREVLDYLKGWVAQKPTHAAR